MSDDTNLIDISNNLRDNALKQRDLQERILTCGLNVDCECMFCEFINEYSDTVVDNISEAIIQFQKDNKVKMCTFDIKNILYHGIKKIRQLEKNAERQT